MHEYWDVAPCSMVEADWHLRGAYFLFHQGGVNLEPHKGSSLSTMITDDVLVWGNKGIQENKILKWLEYGILGISFETGNLWRGYVT